MTMPPGGYPGQPQYPQQPGPGAQPGGGEYWSPPPGYGAGPGQQGGQPPFSPAPVWPAVPPTRKRTRLFIAVVAVVAALGILLPLVAWGISRGGSDPQAQAGKFMTSVQTGDFDGATKLLCKDGRGKFASIAELQAQLVDAGAITGFTLGSVSDSVFEGDKRKDVEVSVQMGDGTTKKVTLSMTKESGTYLVCGF